jgi:hypothetical protein
MISLMNLWMPIVLSAVAVFIASSIIHMVLQYHKDDFKKIPSEDGVMEALRGFNLPPGDYVMPHAGSMKEMGSPEFKEKQNQGPVAFFTVLPNGQCGMGLQLGLWFAFSLLVGVMVAYIARMSLPAGTDYLLVHRVTGATAFCCYSMAHLPSSIWYKKSWMATMRNFLDGLVYGLVTGGMFGWLWPAA